MRIFKLKAFARFQRREKIDDLALTLAAEDALAGAVEAELGGGLFKKRIARAGQGKRGGYRVLLAFRRQDNVFFLFGFAKNERANVDKDELAAWKLIAKSYLDMTADELDDAVIGGDIIEV